MEIPNSPALPPNRHTVPSREEAWGRKIAPSGSGGKKGMKGRYWSHDIAEWLIQQASPFWNTIRKGGTTGDAVAAYVGSRIWRASGGKVTKFVAKQGVKQMVVGTTVGRAGILGAYFATAAVVSHDIYVMLDNNLGAQKFFSGGVQIGGGGFGG